NYTLYFIGRSVSQFGTWMQRTAVVWVVYSVTHSPFLIGATLFAEQFPSFLFAIVGGVAADRFDRYKIIKITQIASMMQAVLLAVLVLTGHTIVWAILVLSVILGIINAFDVPARQALIHEVVTAPADLSNALSLTTATASLAQLLGPALSGLVLSTFGAAVCFFINAASFGAVLVSLLLMKLPEHKHKKPDKKIITEFAEGFAYVEKTKNIGLIILMLGMVSLLVLPYNTVLPVFAKVIFKGDASTFGYISSFVGVGALFATIFLASRRPGAQLKKLLFVFTMIMSAGLIFFSQARNLPLAMLAAVLAGFGSVAQFTISNIIVQSEAAPEMRGRAIGVLLMAIFGMLPIGSLLVGAASEHIGAPATVLIQGIVGLVIVTVFARFLLKRGKPAIPSDLLINEAEEIMAEQHV
ncbi:MAG: MFS transporter, partial [Bacteroidota bacterium]|nr:MFS transporter [Bacteroidota bacterium]